MTKADLAYLDGVIAECKAIQKRVSKKPQTAETREVLRRAKALEAEARKLAFTG